jgi:hypothetical protein
MLKTPCAADTVKPLMGQTKVLRSVVSTDRLHNRFRVIRRLDRVRCRNIAPEVSRLIGASDADYVES